MKCLYGKQRAHKHKEKSNITALEVFVEEANKHIAELSKSKKYGSVPQESQCCG